MRIWSNSYGFPLILLSILSLILGVSGLLFTTKYWTVIFLILGIYSLGTYKSVEIVKNTKVINFYKIYGIFFKYIYDSISVPIDLEYIYYKKRNFSIRTLNTKSFIPDYKSQSDYWIIFVHKDKDNPIRIKFIDYYEGYKIAKYISDTLGCKLTEREKEDDTIEKEDDAMFTKVKKDRRNNLNMIINLTKK